MNQNLNRLISCYLDFSALVVKDPSGLVVEATFFGSAPTVFKSDRATSITDVYMHGNTYVLAGTPGNSIQMDPAFTEGNGCVISDDVMAPPFNNMGKIGPKTTRASRTVSVAAAASAVTNFKFNFPELLLPEIEEVEYSFVAVSAAEPWVQHIQGAQEWHDSDRPIQRSCAGARDDVRPASSAWSAETNPVVKADGIVLFL